MSRLGSFLCIAAFLCCASNAPAAVYVDEGGSDPPRFSSQPWDESYVLLIPDPPLARVAALREAKGRRGPPALEAVVGRVAARHGIDAALVRAVVRIESGGNPGARSAKGALGIMQLMPATAARYGLANPHDAQRNLDAGVRHLGMLLRLHQGNVALALAAYNAGEGAVARHGRRIPPYRETMLYVPKVLLAQDAAIATETGE